MSVDWQHWWKLLHTALMSYGLKILAALVILFIGWWIAKLARLLTLKMLPKRKLGITVQSFLSEIVYFSVLLVVFIAALSKLGVQTASLIAILGAAGLAIALSLKNSLSNFASGILLVAAHPFRVGDFVEVGSASGTVEKIQILFTVLRTTDNQMISMPNTQVMSNKIVNYSSQATRRLSITVGIGYGDNIVKAKKILNDIVTQDKRILTDPEPIIAVQELGESSINLLLRVWVNRQDYWPVTFDTNEQIKTQFDKKGISIPFPQRDVHVFETK